MKSNMEPKDQDRVIRGKRTKRSRQSIRFITTSSSSCGNSSVENSEEDEDMANCLIMLARSGSFEKPNIKAEDEFYLYECKTCNKSFSSFQALGGHRASHKKPKSDQEKKVVVSNDLEDEENLQHKRIINTVTQEILFHNSKAKVHQCSICGSEFGSGQALGGHMRRHRSNATTNSARKIANINENVRNVLELDLNLPAPEDHHRDSKFIFSYSCQAPTLVDCQY